MTQKTGSYLCRLQRKLQYRVERRTAKITPERNPNIELDMKRITWT